MNENDAHEVLEEGVTTGAEVEVDIIEGRRKDPRKVECRYNNCAALIYVNC